MLKVQPKVIRPIELMLVGETGFIIPQSLIFDKLGTCYLAVNLPFKDKIIPEDRFFVGIERTGKGYGQYEVDGTLSAQEYFTQDIPFFDSQSSSFNIFFTPLGYLGSKEKFLQEFFPEQVVQIYRNITAVRNKLEEKVATSPRVGRPQRYFKYNVELDLDTNPAHYPKTSSEREKLKRDMEKGDYTRLLQYAEYFEELKEPLTQDQLDIIFRIEDSQRKEKSP